MTSPRVQVGTRSRPGLLVSTGLAVLELTGQAAAQSGSAVNLCTDLGVQLPGLSAGVAAGASVGLPLVDDALTGLANGVNQNVVGPLSGLGLRLGRIDAAGNRVPLTGANCNVQASALELNTNKGISLGGGRIDGLGAGAAAVAGDASAVAIGNGASASGASGLALGLRGSAAGANTVALGADARASADNAVAIGRGSVADAADTVSVGAAGAERRIVNVAPGRVAATSTDAINGAQLHATNRQVAAALGGGAGTDPDGRLTGPSYEIRGRTYHDVGSALEALDAHDTETTTSTHTIERVSDRVTTNTVRIEKLTERVTNNTSQIRSLQDGRSGVFRADNTSGAPAPRARGADAVAGGYGANAAGRSATALGTNAQATRNDTLAVGAGAKATHTNSAAIGVGAAATRADQVAIGRAGQTYTLAGLDSAASRAAQSGSTRFVTADAGGNIASSSYGPSDIAALDGRVGTLESALGGMSRQVDQDRRDARQGIAAAMAMTSASMPSLPGRTTWALNGATFRGEWAGGAALAHRLDTAVPLALTAGFSYSEASRQGARVGLAGEF